MPDDVLGQLFYFDVPLNEWFTKRLAVTGMCRKGESKEQKQSGTPYTRFYMGVADYHEGEEGPVYIDYIRILRPAEPEEEPQGARP